MTGVEGFARLANQALSLSLDPNETAGKIDKEVLLDTKNRESDEDSHQVKTPGGIPDEKKTEVADSKTWDDGVLKASHTGPAGNGP